MDDPGRSLDWLGLARQHGVPEHEARVLHEDAVRRARLYRERHRDETAIYLELLEEARQKTRRPSPGKVTRAMRLQAHHAGEKRHRAPTSPLTGQSIAPGRAPLTSYVEPPRERRPMSQASDEERERPERIAETSGDTMSRPVPASAAPEAADRLFEVTLAFVLGHLDALDECDRELLAGEVGIDVAAPQQYLALPLRPDANPAPLQRKAVLNERDQTSAVTRSSNGRPMPEDVRAKMEYALGADFSAVRIHEGPQAEAMSALAYTRGTDIHFAPGRYDPGSQRGQELLGHELTHVVQQSRGQVHATSRARGVDINDDPVLEREADELGARAARGERSQGAERLTPPPLGAAGTTVQRQQAPMQAPHYPTVAQQEAIMEELNPVQQAAAGRSPAPVEDPAGFEQEMLAYMNSHIDGARVTAQSRESSGLVHTMTEIQAIADIAEREVQTRYGRYITAAVRAPAEQRRMESFHLRDHLHIVPTTNSPETLVAARHWVESYMRMNDGARIIRAHNVIPGTEQACRTPSSGGAGTTGSPPAPNATGLPGAPGTGTASLVCRDRPLFVRVRDALVSTRERDLRTIILNYPAYERDGTSYIQLRLRPPGAGQTADDARVAGRWDTLRSTIHELLHVLTHREFQAAASVLEQRALAIEGFTQYFTRQTYEAITERVESDETLRRSIQGREGWFPAPPLRAGSYGALVAAVERIREQTNEESLRVAYFMGQLAFIGLGSWTREEANRREEALYPGNLLQVGVLVTDDRRGFFTLQYGRILAGRTGEHQFVLGSELGFMTPPAMDEPDAASRLGLGVSASYRYQSRAMYVVPSVGLGVSGGLSGSFADSLRADIVPGFSFGARLGIYRFGVNERLLVPFGSGSTAPQGVGVAGGAQFSLDL